MNVAKLFWVLGLLLCACEDVGYDKLGPAPRRIYVPEGATEAQVKYVETAVEAYNKLVGRPVFELRMAADMSATGCAIRVSFHDDLGSAIVLDDETGEEHELNRLGRFVTNARQCWGRLQLHSVIQDQTIVQHELGHSIGLKHTGDPKDTMYERRVGGQSLQSYVRTHVESLPHN